MSRNPTHAPSREPRASARAEAPYGRICLDRARGTRRGVRRLRSLCIAAVITLAAHLSEAQLRVTVESTQYYTLGDPVPMLMPSGVSAAPDGSLFVADGVNHRVIHFTRDGAAADILTGDDAAPFDRPMAVHAANDGRLFIADTGNVRIAIRAADGRWLPAVDLAASLPAPPPDVTGLALDADGSTLWFADNDGHRIGRFDTQGGGLSTLGGQGESLGQFHYPFKLAITPGGDILVSEAINARVQVVTGRGVPVGSIGAYGIEPGHFHRPKGVAADRDGRVWIADGTTGAIQVFDDAGKLLGVVRDRNDRMLNFANPADLAFDGDGRLYVVELGASRIARLTFRIEATLPGQPAVRIEASRAQRQPKNCTACHVEWMEPFNSGGGTALMAAPESPASNPLVSQTQSCLNCHDGSTVDSRRFVWRDHGHRTGVAPPPGMVVPDDLPLVNGQLACRTCHSAHTRAGAGQDFRTAVFLRVEQSPGELCIKCHSEGYDDATGRHHPLTGMTSELPRLLLDAGAQPGVDASNVTCLTCHVAHGSRDDTLLVTGASTNALCLACHSQTHAELFGADDDRTHGGHPIDAILSAAQRDAVTAIGARVEPDGGMLCLSCHRTHHAATPRNILADTLEGGALCLRCHDGQAAVFGTAHDLTISAVEERNLRGVTAAEGGTCSACHGMHEPARAAHVGIGDPNGNCLTCHRAGQCGELAGGDPLSHPVTVEDDLLRRLRTALGVAGTTASSRREDASTLTCIDCHDPHGSEAGHFLRASADVLCSTCHVEQARLAGGPHDFPPALSDGAPDPDDATRVDGDVSDPSVPRNARGRSVAEAGRCGFCHAIHQAGGPALWAVSETPPAEADDLCLACHAGAHAESAIVAGRAPALLHPRSAPSDGSVTASAGLPLFNAAGSRAADGSIACATCHDPHANVHTSPNLLRGVQAGQEPIALCASCHQQAERITGSMHDAQVMAAYSRALGAPGPATCGPCHAVHEVEGQPAAVVSAAPLSEDLSAQCTVCHAGGGSELGPRRIVQHPAIAMRNLAPPGDPRFMPLVDDQGRLGAAGRITCQTCHVHHGRAELSLPEKNLAPRPRPALDDASDVNYLSATRPMIRPYVGPNLCSTCHGADGLTRFLFYHDPARRKPAIDAATR